MKDFLIIILAALVIWMFVDNPPDMQEVQRSVQSFVARGTAVYTFDTSAPAAVTLVAPQWPTAAIVTATQQPTGTPTAVPATPEAQRGEQGNERGCLSYRTCDE